MAIKEVNVDTKLDSPESLLLQLIESKKYDLSRHQSKLQEYDKSFAKDMDALKLRYDTYKKDTALEINGIEQALSDLTLLNLEEIIAPYETQGDRMVKVLYGSNK